MKKAKLLSWADAHRAMKEGKQVLIHVQGRQFSILPEDTVETLRSGALGGLDVSIADVEHGKLTIKEPEA